MEQSRKISGSIQLSRLINTVVDILQARQQKHHPVRNTLPAADKQNHI